MKINKLKINGYGKIKNKEINLEKNINLIYGKNESGKSTILNFITDSFYGISKNKKGKEHSNYDKYLPWTGEEFSGKVEYELDNKERLWIQFYHSNNRDYGYNLDSGGRSGGAKSDETKRKIGITTKEKWNNPDIAEKMRNGLQRGTDTMKKNAKKYPFICPVCNKT